MHWENRTKKPLISDESRAPLWRGGESPMELYALKMGLLLDTPLSLSTLITLRSAIWSFFIMGKSKSTLKKIGKQYTFLQRLRLCQVKDGKESCKYHKKTLEVF